MAAALDVAKLLIHLAAGGDEADFLTPLRVQKLLYYCEGWSLARRGQRLFPDHIEAWPHGPVVPGVWRYFSKFGSNPIIPAEVPRPGRITPAEQKLIVEVWDGYKGFSAWALRTMTHEEEPWVEARAGCSPTAKTSRRISRATMRRFFSELDEAEA